MPKWAERLVAQTLKHKICILSIIFVLIAVFSPSRTWVVEASKNAPTGVITKKKAIPNPEYVRNYVIKQAKQFGINPVIADWIVNKESSYGQRMVGPEPNGTVSYGYWQFNNANESFNYDCSMDLKCSTHLALQWILQGKVNKWTTWANRKLWFENAPD